MGRTAQPQPTAATQNVIDPAVTSRRSVILGWGVAV